MVIKITSMAEPFLMCEKLTKYSEISILSFFVRLARGVRVAKKVEIYYTICIVREDNTV